MSMRSTIGTHPARRRFRQRAAVVCAITALAVAGLSTTSAAAASGPSVPSRLHLSTASTTPVRAPQAITAGNGTTHYAVNKPLCGAPTSATGPTCYALRRVEVPKGTPGSYAYSLPAYQRGPSGGYTPKDLAKAYGYNPGVNRRNQTVGIVDWFDDPHALSDLNRFDAHYRLPRETSRSFRKVNQRGRTSPLPSTNRSSAGEIALDVQAVRAVCHTCRILLVEADRGSDNDLAAAENTAARLGADEISNSYGAVEHKVPNRVRAAFNHPGIVITASTGDAGWYGWDDANAGYRAPNRASYPSTDPHVIAVGGTGLTLRGNGTRASEYVWNGNLADDHRGATRQAPQGASGGGCSHLYAAPAWQRKTAGYAAAGCGGKRLAADVAAIADPQTGFDVLNSFAPKGWPNWLTVGGTSLSSPVVAAMWALAGGSGGSAYPGASLYLNRTHRASSLFDVTVGSNAFCGGDTTAHCSKFTHDHFTPHVYNPNALGAGNIDCSFPRNKSNSASPPPLSSECNAVKGFDGPTGVGTPRNPKLLQDTSPNLSISRPTRVRPHHSTGFTGHAREPLSGVRVVRFGWRFGDGHGATRSTGGIHHTYKRAGRYTLTLTVSDNAGQVVIIRRTITVR